MYFSQISLKREEWRGMHIPMDFPLRQYAHSSTEEGKAEVTNNSA